MNGFNQRDIRISKRILYKILAIIVLYIFPFISYRNPKIVNARKLRRKRLIPYGNENINIIAE